MINRSLLYSLGVLYCVNLVSAQEGVSHFGFEIGDQLLDQTNGLSPILKDRSYLTQGPLNGMVAPGYDGNDNNVSDTPGACCSGQRPSSTVFREFTVSGDMFGSQIGDQAISCGHPRNLLPSLPASPIFDDFREIAGILSKATVAKRPDQSTLHDDEYTDLARQREIVRSVTKVAFENATYDLILAEGLRSLQVIISKANHIDDTLPNLQVALKVRPVPISEKIRYARPSVIVIYPLYPNNPWCSKIAYGKFSDQAVQQWARNLFEESGWNWYFDYLTMRAQVSKKEQRLSPKFNDICGKISKEALNGLVDEFPNCDRLQVDLCDGSFGGWDSCPPDPVADAVQKIVQGRAWLSPPETVDVSGFRLAQVAGAVHRGSARAASDQAVAGVPRQWVDSDAINASVAQTTGVCGKIIEWATRLGGLYESTIGDARSLDSSSVKQAVSLTSGEDALLMSEKARLERERVLIDQEKAKVAYLNGEVDRLQADIVQKTSILADAEKELKVIESNVADAFNGMKGLRDTRAQLQASESAVSLKGSCVGLSYYNCSSQDDKLNYDREKFRLNASLADSGIEFSSAQGKIIEIMKAYIASQNNVLETRTKIFEERLDEAVKAQSAEELSREVEARSTIYESDMYSFKELFGEHLRDARLLGIAEAILTYVTNLNQANRFILFP